MKLNKELTGTEEDINRLANNMDYPKLVFLQINRINQAMIDNLNFYTSVDGLNCMTSWLRDSKFSEELQQLNEWKNKEETAVLSEKGTIYQKDRDSINNRYYLTLYEKLVELLGRKGVLGEKEIDTETI